MKKLLLLLILLPINLFAQDSIVYYLDDSVLGRTLFDDYLITIEREQLFTDIYTRHPDITN